jgi:hypothetical protein
MLSPVAHLLLILTLPVLPKGCPAYVLERKHVLVPNPTAENTTLVVHIRC